MLLLEWGVWIYLALFFLKNKWLKCWFIWVVLCLIFQYNRYSYAFANTILLYTLFYQVMEDRLTKRNIGHILNGICIIAWLHLIWMILQWQDIWWLYKSAARGQWAIFGLVANSNNAGMLLALSVPCFLRRKWWIMLSFILGGIILSKHETSLVAVIVGLLAYVWIKFPKWRFTAVGLIIVVCLSYFRFRDPKDLAYSINIRFNGFRRMWQVIKASPLQGLGLGQFRNVFYAIQKYFYKDTSLFFRAHNVGLQLLLEQGAIGLGLMAGFVCSVSEKFLTLKKKDNLAFIAFIGLVIAGIGCLAHFTAQTSSFVIPIFYMAVVVNQTQK